MCVCVNVYVYVCVPVYEVLCVCVFVCLFVFVCVWVCVFVFVCVCVSVCLYISLYLCVCVYVCVRVCICKTSQGFQSEESLEGIFGDLTDLVVMEFPVGKEIPLTHTLPQLFPNSNIP